MWLQKTLVPTSLHLSKGRGLELIPAAPFQGKKTQKHPSNKRDFYRDGVDFLAPSWLLVGNYGYFVLACGSLRWSEAPFLLFHSTTLLWLVVCCPSFEPLNGWPSEVAFWVIRGPPLHLWEYTFRSQKTIHFHFHHANHLGIAQKLRIIACSLHVLYLHVFGVSSTTSHFLKGT